MNERARRWRSLCRQIRFPASSVQFLANLWCGQCTAEQRLLDDSLFFPDILSHGGRGNIQSAEGTVALSPHDRGQHKRRERAGRRQTIRFETRRAITADSMTLVGAGPDVPRSLGFDCIIERVTRSGRSLAPNSFLILGAVGDSPRSCRARCLGKSQVV